MSTITWQKQNYDLSAMTAGELNDLLDWITNAASDQVCFAEGWTVGQWQERRGAYDRFLTECRNHKEALEIALEYPQVVPAPEPPTLPVPIPTTEKDNIIKFALSRRVELNNLLLARLSEKAETEVTIFDLDTHQGKNNRIAAAWDLLQGGAWQLPEKANMPFEVLSRTEAGLLHQVYVKAYGHPANECYCQSGSYGMSKAHRLYTVIKLPCVHWIAMWYVAMALRMASREAGKVAA